MKKQNNNELARLAPEGARLRSCFVQQALMTSAPVPQKTQTVQSP